MKRNFAASYRTAALLLGAVAPAVAQTAPDVSSLIKRLDERDQRIRYPERRLAQAEALERVLVGRFQLGF